MVIVLSLADEEWEKCNVLHNLLKTEKDIHPVELVNMDALQEAVDYVNSLNPEKVYLYNTTSDFPEIHITSPVIHVSSNI